MSSRAARAAIIHGGIPWHPGAGDPPQIVNPQGWHYFNAHEAATVEALVDRLIPADDLSPGGKDCGCAVFIDRQLAGPYGHDGGQYRSGPFQKGTKQQGDQSPETPAQEYHKALAAFDAACRAKYGGKNFADLGDEQKDEAIKGLEEGSLKLDGVDGEKFFNRLLKNTRTGFFADPLYGGNKDMASWKMIGFPGTHYDYRAWMDRHNQHIPLPTVSIGTHPNWTKKS